MMNLAWAQKDTTSEIRAYENLAVDYFYLGDLRYHDHNIEIIWKKDWDKLKPGNQSKLIVWVDGERAAESKELTQALKVQLP